MQVVYIYFYIDFTKYILYNITIEQTIICFMFTLILPARERKESYKFFSVSIPPLVLVSNRQYVCNNKNIIYILEL